MKFFDEISDDEVADAIQAVPEHFTLYLAAGQLPNSQGTLLAQLGADTHLNISLANTSSSSTETINILVQHGNGTAYAIVGQIVLPPLYTWVYSNLPFDGADTLLGNTTDATTVSYRITSGTGVGPSGGELFDNNGNFAQTNLQSATASTISSSSATAFVVGPNGSVNPVLTIVSGSTFKTGVSLTGAAGGSGAAIAATSNETNESMTIDAKGSGVVTIGSVSTGGCNVRLPVIAPQAASGTTIANVNTFLKEGFNSITGANNALAVQLPVGAVGMQVRLVNASYTAALVIFPQVNSIINNLAANASYNLGIGGQRLLTYAAAGQWYTDPSTIV